MVDGALDPKYDVIVVVFSAPPTIGWMLYFSGTKRAPIISKWRQEGVSAREIGDEAMRYLIHDLQDEDALVGLRVLSSSRDPIVDNLPPHRASRFLIRDKPVRGEDREVFQYLFDRNPMVALSKKKMINEYYFLEDERRWVPLAPLPMSGPILTPVSADTVIMATDASHTRASSRRPEMGGTGWVIEFHDEAGNPVIESGSKNYAGHEEGHDFTANTFEMYAVRDALNHMLLLSADLMGRVSRVILYSDSTFVVRALLDRKPNVPMEQAVDDIHDLIDGLGSRGISVEYMWTKGHADNRWNQMAHDMAAIGREATSD